MKLTSYIFTLVFLISFVSLAQDETTTEKKPIYERKHEIKGGAIKLLAGPIFEGTYEYIKSKDFTFGASLLVNLSDNDWPENFSITPFARFYFQESKEYGAKGFFVEGFGKFAVGNDNYNDYDTESTKDDYAVGALGISLGKKWINKSGFVFEILVGAGRTLGGPDQAPVAFPRADLFLGYRF